MDEIMMPTNDLLQEKERRRIRLAHLPYPKKVRIVVELQRMQAPILSARSRKVRVWDVDFRKRICCVRSESFELSMLGERRMNRGRTLLVNRSCAATFMCH